MSRFAAFFESLVVADPRPYSARQAIAQRRVQDLLSLDGDRHRGLPCLHLAGSKGKGSTALYAEALLRALGYSTGTFLSPHLSRWTERYRIDGEEISSASLDSAVDSLRPAVACLRERHPDAPPSFFDALTAVAFHVFGEAKVDFGIIEAGLGGRFDATLVCDTRVACITSIELEHTDKLGDTLSAIAAHKAGIVKSGRPVVLGPVPDAAGEVIAAQANAVGAPLRRAGESFEIDVTGDGFGTRLVYVDGAFRLETELPVASEMAAINAGLALDSVRQLVGQRGEMNPDVLSRALSGVILPGRTEVLGEQRRVVIDCAHTEASARALAMMLKRQPASAIHLVVSFTTGKDVDTVLEVLLPLASRLTSTCAEPTRSIDPHRVAQTANGLAPALEVEVEPDPVKALSAAMRVLAPGHLLCVAGSVYLAGVAREILPAMVGNDASPRVECPTG